MAVPARRPSSCQTVLQPMPAFVDFQHPRLVPLPPDGTSKAAVGLDQPGQALPVGSPFADGPDPKAENRWVLPELRQRRVRGGSGKLRQASFKELRDDKDPSHRAPGNPGDEPL